MLKCVYADTDDVSGVLALAHNYLIINEVYLMNNNIINKYISVYPGCAPTTTGRCGAR